MNDMGLPLFVAAFLNALKHVFPLFVICIFEHLRKTLYFLEVHFHLKFCVFQPFYYLRSMLRCTTDTNTPFSVSLMWAIYKVDITCACLKLGAKAAPQTVKHAHDIL